MLWPLLLVGGGAFLLGASKAKQKTATVSTTVRKRVMGPVSGREYLLEDFPDSGFFVVQYEPDRTLVTYRRVGTGKELSQSKGNPTTIAIIRQDFEK